MKAKKPREVVRHRSGVATISKNPRPALQRTKQDIHTERVHISRRALVAMLSAAGIRFPAGSQASFRLLDVSIGTVKLSEELELLVEVVLPLPQTAAAVFLEPYQEPEPEEQ